MKQTDHYILIVDDNLKNLQLVAKILRDKGYSIGLSQDAVSAKKSIEDKKPDLLLLDVMMPVMNGYELCRELKESKEFGDIPIIFLTAKTDAGDLAEGFDVGGVDYITKPFNGIELFTRVKNHIELSQARETIKQKAEELKIANETLEQKVIERTKELQKKKDIIEQKNREITDSIMYARRIQTAILPPGDYIQSIFPKRFILFKPKDIVSGDFYWISKVGDRIISITADCTGHGVPGAFMSLLGIAFLNEIVNRDPELHASKILGLLREKIINSLHQSGHSASLSNDGIDVALYILNEKKHLLEYAGANNPLYMVRNKEIHIYKPDHMPIGIHYGEKEEFTNNNIEVQEGDIIYTFSDGFYDQFGGKNNKKLKVKGFKELLIDISVNEMQKQKELLDYFLTKWMDNNDQTDDILVMGVRI